MSKIVVFPAFERPLDCADQLARLCWHLRPHHAAVGGIRIFASFDALPKSCGAYLEAGLLEAETSQPLIAKVQLAAAPESRTAWKQAMTEADRVLVWRRPDGEVFEGLEELYETAGAEKVVVIDEAAEADATLNLAEFALSLTSRADRMVANARERLVELRRKLKKRSGYLFGTGPSLDETERYDLSDGHAIICNELIANEELMARVHPVALAFADPVLHAGPSAAAAAYRQQVYAQMQQRDLWLVLPLRDYLPISVDMPKELRHRTIPVPGYAEGPPNVNLLDTFAVRQRPNVMTQLMLPLAASLFERIGVCGADGRSGAEDSAFWSHHRDSGFDDHLSALTPLHPAYAAREEAETYQHYCTDFDRLCRAAERAGRTVVGITASFIPALRRRGAAEPVGVPQLAAEADDAVVLSVTPDLRDRIGHFWNYEQHLGPMVESGGLPYWIAANALWKEDAPEEAESGAEATTIDCSLYTFSWTLANKPHESDAYHAAMRIQVLHELRAAVGRALAACSGRLHVYMYCGSLEHAEILYEIARDNPRMSVHVNLFWFRSAEAWRPRFLERWFWLLRAAEKDPRLSLTAMTAHQKREIYQRSGVSLPVAAHPSPLMSDQIAWRLLNEPLPEKKAKRVFFPSANRPEKGTGLLYEAARLVVEQIGDEEIELVFRTSPFGSRKDAEEDPIHPYVKVLEGHIELDDFIANLRSCHAVVLPYLPPDFADRTSGIVVDALYCGTPTVVMRGTFLAEVAQRYGSGIVVDEGRPEEVAEAIIELLHAPPERWDFREAAKLYFRGNSWQRLAQEVITARPDPAAAPLIGRVPESKAPPVALVGPVPREQEGRSDELAALVASLREQGVGLDSVDLLEARRDLPLALLSSDGSALAVAASPRAAQLTEIRTKRARPKLAGRLTVTPPPARLDAAGLMALVKDYAPLAAGKACSLVLGNDPAVALAALAVVGEHKPAAALIAFDDEVLEAQLTLAERLDQMGYLVLVAEHHPRLRRFEERTLRRLAAYPFVSDLPWANGTVLALPAGTDLQRFRTLFLKSRENLAYHEEEDPTEKGLEIWEVAKPPAQEKVLQAAATPNAEWQLHGFNLTGRRSDGYAVLGETETMRVHRTAIRGTAKAGEPLTFAIDVVEHGRRFVTLWLTDAKNQPRAEATLDLEKGQLLRSQCFLKDSQMFAVAVPLGPYESGKTAYRAWLSIDSYPDGEEVQAQLLTRAASMGGLQHRGEADKGVLARNFLLELSATPSRFE